MESKRDSMGHLGTHLVSVGLKGDKMDSFWVATTKLHPQLAQMFSFWVTPSCKG